MLLYVATFLTAAIVGLAFWTRFLFFGFMAVLAPIFYGAYWMQQGSDWIFKGLGIIIMLIGIYVLINIAMDLWLKRSYWRV